MKKIILIVLTLFIAVAAYAGTVTRYSTYSTNGQVTATNLNGNFDNIVNEMNGGIDNTNIDTVSGYRLYEILGSTPAAGTEGRMVYNTATNHLNLDNGASFDDINGEFFVGTFTRNKSTATSTQAVTGVGFKPKAVIVFCTVSNSAGMAAWGMFTGTGTQGQGIFDYQNATAAAYVTSNGGFCEIYDSGSVYYTGTFSSFDTDGFTISWTRTGSTASATITGNFIAIK